MADAASRYDSLVRDVLTPLWKQQGWRRQGNTWYFAGVHGFATRSLQRSQWNTDTHCRFRLNTGVYHPALAALERGTHHSCARRTMSRANCSDVARKL